MNEKERDPDSIQGRERDLKRAHHRRSAHSAHPDFPTQQVPSSLKDLLLALDLA